ncbi:hypothetical protein ACVPPR_01675 [Dellaglioa sp. L3N]
MFKAMLKYRLATIWRNLIIAYLIVEGAMIITEVILSIKIADVSVLTSTLGISLAAGGLIVTQITLMILSFTTTRKPFNFGILNGISRKVSYTTQLISLFGSQLVTFAIFYPLVGLIVKMARPNIDMNMFDFQLVAVILAVIWSVMAGAIEISSFVTLFEHKIWWLLFIVWMIIAPTWGKFMDFVNLGNDGKFNFNQLYTIPIILLTQIVLPLLIAGVCQYFMQTKRITLSFKRFK